MILHLASPIPTLFLAGTLNLKSRRRMPGARHSLHQVGAVLPRAPEGVRLWVLMLLNASSSK